MRSRVYVERIVELLDSRLEKDRALKGYVERSFYDSPQLKEEVKTGAKTIFEVLSYKELSDIEFDEAYELSVRESKHKNQRALASIGLSSKEARKRNWLTDERILELGWNNNELKTYRGRYLVYLDELGRSQSYIRETDRSSLEITKRLGDPKSELPFDVRGLVVGSVQSGKTANFNAVINSAIDTGYGLIIVLSGIMEDLRKQTQRRIEKEVEGKFENGEFIGVGSLSSFGDSAYAQHSDVNSISVPTSVETDFKKSIKEADFSLNNKNILVCKKNTSVLKNLLLWLHNYLNVNKEKIRVPLLILDDEADNASLNNLGEKGVEYASKINGHIRALLGLFEKKTYLGYTATPFGNILQDRNEAPAGLWEIDDGGTSYEFEQTDSLFPRDFIELLFPPPNYIGAKHFFETVTEEVTKIEPLLAPPVVDHVSTFPSRIDVETGKPTRERGRGTRAARKDDDFPKALPKSLEDAVMCFAISTAIRLSRKPVVFGSKLYQPHNTMLVHVSRFITWQSRTKDLIIEFVRQLEEGLQNDNPSDASQVYGSFEIIWNKYYAYIVSNISTFLSEDYQDEFLVEKSFQDVKPLLITAVQRIEVKAINSNPPKNTLSYPEDEEKTYIAVGGNRLSRGFTLEGLTINYFIRDTNFADTLLQMGRWFGYRPGYIDCCKLFSTSDAINKFDQTSLTIEDVEQKFIDMNRDPSNTPEKYAVKVLTHPGVLKVTRNSILKNAEEIKFSYSDHLIQTKKFLVKKNVLEDAWAAFSKQVLSKAPEFETLKNGKGDAEYLIYETKSISDLFDFFELPAAYRDHDLEELRRYIESCNESNKLTDWTIAIKAAGNGRKISLVDLGVSTPISRTVRKGPSKSQPDLLDRFVQESIFSAGGKSANIFSGGKDFQLRLSQVEIEEAEQVFRTRMYTEIAAQYPGMPDQDIRERARKKTIPEKVYRQKMSDKEGILIIYLMDLDEVFRSDGNYIEELNDLRNSVNTDIPLIGYAIGIPPVEGDIGANYLQSKFHREEVSDDDEYEDLAEILDEH